MRRWQKIWTFVLKQASWQCRLTWITYIHIPWQHRTPEHCYIRRYLHSKSRIHRHLQRIPNSIRILTALRHYQSLHIKTKFKHQLLGTCRLTSLHIPPKLGVTAFFQSLEEIVSSPCLGSLLHIPLFQVGNQFAVRTVGIPYEVFVLHELGNSPPKMFKATFLLGALDESWHLDMMSSMKMRTPKIFYTSCKLTYR